MGERIALAINGGSGWTVHELAQVARAAEDANFEAIFSAEIRTDAIPIALFMGSQTRRIKIGTWVSNIYLRHPLVCAQGAGFIAEATGGRMILGLGVSHPAVNRLLGIEMVEPLTKLQEYIADVRRLLKRQGPEFAHQTQTDTYQVPIYVAALTSKALEQAGEIADGILPVFWNPARVKQAKVWIDRGKAQRSDGISPVITLGIPTFVGDDLEKMRSIARSSIGYYAMNRTYQRLFRTLGFEVEADAAERGQASAAVTDRLLDAFCLVGPANRCRERLAEFREAGVELPILYVPAGPASAENAVRAFQ